MAHDARRRHRRGWLRAESGAAGRGGLAVAGRAAAPAVEAALAESIAAATAAAGGGRTPLWADSKAIYKPHAIARRSSGVLAALACATGRLPLNWGDLAALTSLVEDDAASVPERGRRDTLRLPTAGHETCLPGRGRRRPPDARRCRRDALRDRLRDRAALPVQSAARSRPEQVRHPLADHRAGLWPPPAWPGCGPRFPMSRR